MYLLVTTSGEYENEEYIYELNTLQDLLEMYSNNEASFVSAYRIDDKYNRDHLNMLISQQTAKREAAIAAARAKLTPEECVLLGI